MLMEVLKDENRTQLQQQYADLRYHKWVYDSKASIETAIENLKKLEFEKTSCAFNDE